MMLIDSEFEIRQTVYLKTDKEQLKRIVTAMTIRHGGVISYELTCGTTCSWHRDFEMSNKVDAEITLGIEK